MIRESIINEYDKKISYIENGIIIGYIIIRKMYENVDITDVFVNKEYRGKGYGGKLLDYVTLKYGDYKLMLEVNENNKVARKLYESRNFKEISIRKKYYKDGDAIIMERS